MAVQTVDSDVRTDRTSTAVRTYVPDIHSSEDWTSS